MPVDGRAALALDFSDRASPRVVQDGHALSPQSPKLFVQKWGAPSGKLQSSKKKNDTKLTPLNDPWGSPRKQQFSQRDKTTIQETIEFDDTTQCVATWSEENGALWVRGELTTKSPEDIPVTLGISVPVEASQLKWLVDLHREEPVTGAEEKCYSTLTPAGARAAMSRYPFGGIAADGKVVGLGLPLATPRIHRIRWDGEKRALIGEIDVTLSTIPRTLKGRVPFEFVVFDAPSEFGFRGLAQSYYKLNPDSYRKRVQWEGQWMPFTQLDKVERVEDFGFAFHEYHPDVSVAWDNKNGVYPLVYCEPPVQYIQLEDSFPRELNKLKEYLATLDTPQGSAVRSSGAMGPDNELLCEWVVTPWAKGARIPTNCDPEVLRDEKNPVNAFDLNWTPYAELARRRAEDTPSEWRGSGVIVDGVVGAAGRCLYLKKTELVSQKFPQEVNLSKEAVLTVTAKGRKSPRLTISAASNAGVSFSQEIQLGSDFSPYSVSIPASTYEEIKLACAEGEVWIDSLQCAALPLRNNEFEAGSHDLEMPRGLYMDSFEGWDSYKLNFRRDHLERSDYPLTFDSETGRAAQVIMFHSFEFAREVGRRLHERGPYLLMANTALYQWPWSAGLLDVLGIETPWGNSARTESLDYIRTMLYQKPYCFLLNVAFANFRGEKVEEYFAKAFHYGFWPGFFSHDAANNPYWEQPSLYNEDRPLFLKYMRVQRRTTAAGWEPVTLAETNLNGALIERWGGGTFAGAPLAPQSFYLTVHNTSDTTAPVRVECDPRLTGKKKYLVLEALSGQMLATGEIKNVTVPVGAHRTAALYFVSKDVQAVQEALKTSSEELAFLIHKHMTYGNVSEEAGKQLEQELRSPAKPAHLCAKLTRLGNELPEEYRFEWNRALSEWVVLASANEEIASGKIYEPRYSMCAVPGSVYRIEIKGSAENEDLSLEWVLGNLSRKESFKGGVAEIPIPTSSRPGDFLTWRISSTSPERLAPYYVATVPILPPVTVSNLPHEFVMRDQGRLTFELINNTGTPLDLKVITREEGGALKPIKPVEIHLEGEASYPVELPLESAGPLGKDVRTQLDLTVQSGQNQVSLRVPLIILGQDSSLLRQSDVTVTVDSCYLGYSEKPLNDGVTETAGIDWAEAAWASDEGSVPHWAQFDFAHPAQLREVTLHWAYDDGKYWSSRKVAVQIRRPEASDWETVATIETDKETPQSTVRFAPVRVKGLRIFQDAGNGPARRRGILWLREVEAR